jgi:hypothetical protein
VSGLKRTTVRQLSCAVFLLAPLDNGNIVLASTSPELDAISPYWLDDSFVY